MWRLLWYWYISHMLHDSTSGIDSYSFLFSRVAVCCILDRSTVINNCSLQYLSGCILDLVERKLLVFIKYTFINSMYMVWPWLWKRLVCSCCVTWIKLILWYQNQSTYTFKFNLCYIPLLHERKKLKKQTIIGMCKNFVKKDKKPSYSVWMAAYNKNNMLNLMCRLLCNYILIIEVMTFKTCHWTCQPIVMLGLNNKRQIPRVS